MIYEIVKKLKSLTNELQNAIILDIEDVKKANHDGLIERNEVKLELMDNLTTLKKSLNEELSKEYQSGVDISKYKDNIDELEGELKKLYKLNGKLASIVLPVKEMYKEIIDDIKSVNGGSIVEVMA